MADETKVIISIETILKNLDRTLKGLSTIEKRLKALSNIKLGAAGGTSNINAATAATQRAATQSQRLQLQQQRLQLAQQRVAISTQNVANAQQRANLATQRLAAAQQRLTQTTAQLGQQQNSHVQFFKAQQQAAQNFNKTILATGNALRSLGQGVASVGATLSVTLTAPLIAFGATVTDAAVTLDSLKRGLTTIAGSAQEAQRQLVRLTAIAKLPGIGFEEAIQGSIRLQAVGFSAREAERALVQFSNAVALTGGGRDELQRITVQLGQLAAKGKVLAQDLRPIIEAAPAVGRALKQAFGTVNADDIAELTGSSEEFLKVLIAQLEQLPRAAAGARNAFENFRDEVFRASAAIGTALLPALTQLIQIAGPIVTRLAEAFASLPRPLQTTLLVLGAFTAALGPVLFITGQLTTGIGRILVGLAQLNAIGLIPAIRNLNLYRQGLIGSAVAQKSLTALTFAGATVFGAVATTLAFLVTAYVAYKSAQEESVNVTEDQLNSQEELITGLEGQLQFLNQLKDGVATTADEQNKLKEIYDALNVVAQVRVTGIKDEEQRTAALRVELEKLIRLKQQEQAQTAATITGNLANTLLQIDANEKEIKSNVARVQANTDLADAIRRTNTLTAEQSTQLARQGINASNVEEALGGLQTESENLVRSNQALRETTEGLNGDAKEQAQILAVAEKQTGLNARQLLIAAKNMGVFRGDVDATVERLKVYTDQTKDATKATDDFNKSLSQQSQDLNKAGDAAEEAEKQRRKLISSAVGLAKEASDSLEGALKTLKAFIAANPQLAEAVRKQAQVSGKTIDEFLKSAIGIAEKSRGSLVNSQEALADASARVQQEAAEKEIALQKSKNDELLRLNETRFKQELIGFKEFASERARLQRADVEGEIERQRKIIELANQDILRARERARATTGTGRVKAEADEQASIAKRTAAETKIIELRSKQEDIATDTNNEIREFDKDRLKDFRELTRELNEIIGKEKEAGEAAIDERFADQLRELNTEKAKALDEVQRATATAAFNQQIAEFKAQRDALTAELTKLDKTKGTQAAERRVQINQQLVKLTEDEVKAALEFQRVQEAGDKASIEAQIARINNHKTELKSLVALADAQEQIRKAQDEQANLERELQFEVEFRGLSEQEAVARRLEGEKRVRSEIEKQQIAIQGVIDKLRAAGLEIPTALLESVRRFDVAIKGLGELSFSDQFRLAEMEFNRINDERLNKIAEVEDAINRRTIAEVQGLLKIRLINAEYVGDLEEQSRILSEIAKQSNDPRLIQQARQVQQTTRDANTELEDFNTRLRSVSIDALQQGLSDFFSELGDNTKTAKERVLDLVNSITRSITDFIARDFSRQIIESIFGTGDQQAGAATGLIASFKRIFGIGGAAESTKAIDTGFGTAGKAAETGQVTAAATALSTAGTTTAAAITTGGSSFAVTVASSAVSFASSVVAAGAAFAAAVAAGSAAQAAGGAGSALAGAFAATGMFPAVPGGLVRIVEGGFPEAVLTTDPKHAAQQVRILSRYLKETKGLFGRIPGFAQGGFDIARDAEAEMLQSLSNSRSGIPAPSPSLQPAVSGGDTNLRILNLWDRKQIAGGYIRSAEGARDILNVLTENASEVSRRISIK